MKIGPLEYLVLGQKGQGMLKFQYCPKCDKEHDIMTDCVVMTKTNIVGKQEFEFKNDYIYFWLDRSQAYLLMLYLQEHLKK